MNLFTVILINVILIYLTGCVVVGLIIYSCDTDYVKNQPLRRKIAVSFSSWLGVAAAIGDLIE